MERVKMTAEKLEKAVDEMNVAEQRFMCQFDTIEQLYFEKEKMYLEKMSEAEERHAQEKKDMRKHYLKIILSIAIPFLVLLSSIIGGIIYITTNFDIGFQTYQEVSAEGGGNSTIEDGIHFDRPPHSVDN